MYCSIIMYMYMYMCMCVLYIINFYIFLDQTNKERSCNNRPSSSP